MKTITVTHQNSINYGAVLQSYALQKQLSKLGVDDEILDLKSLNKVYFRELRIGKALPSDIFNNIINLLYITKTMKRIYKFKKFVENNIKMTRHYRTFQEVINNPPVADAYITGSDQTFNTDSLKKHCNFLRFGREKTKRISYAASMGGKPAVEDKHRDEFISDIKTYSSLSVREPCSAAYISKLCNMPCSTHIDPALLLTKNEWSELASRSSLCPGMRREKYILVYPLLNNPLLNHALNKLKSETGLDVIVVNPNSRCYIKGDIIIRDAGPLEFLSLFENATYILTTTFHGVCFSLLFEKDFFTFISKKNEIRINSLLNLLNISDRIISDVSNITLNEISYGPINKIIESEREKATEYLVKALGIYE